MVAEGAGSLLVAWVRDDVGDDADQHPLRRVIGTSDSGRVRRVVGALFSTGFGARTSFDRGRSCERLTPGTLEWMESECTGRSVVVLWDELGGAALVI